MPRKQVLIPGKLRDPALPKIGRPTNEEAEARRIETILERVSAGETLEKVCKDLGGISPTKFRRWARSTKDNREMWADARREYAHSLFDRMADLSELLRNGTWGREDNAAVTAIRVAIDALKHITARLNPDDYAERKDQKAGVQVTIVSSLPLRQGSAPEKAIDTAFRVVGQLPTPEASDSMEYDRR